MIKVHTIVANVEKHLIITGHSVNMLGELIKETHVKDEGKHWRAVEHRMTRTTKMEIINKIINYAPASTISIIIEMLLPISQCRSTGRDLESSLFKCSLSCEKAVRTY